jgi:PhnO protein
VNTTIIRFATAADFKSVYRFINLLENEVMDETTQRELYLENIQHSNIIYLLATVDQKPVGFLSFHIQNLMHHGGKIGEIQELYVDESVRNMGIGKQLTDEIKSIAKGRNVIQLEVTSRLSRTSAHRFYEREGFNFTHKKFLHKL